MPDLAEQDDRAELYAIRALVVELARFLSKQNALFLNNFQIKAENATLIPVSHYPNIKSDEIRARLTMLLADVDAPE